METRSAMLQVLVLLNVLRLVSSSLTFLNGSLSGTSYYSTPVTRFLGPQSDFSVDAELVYVSESGCHAAEMVDKAQVQGRVVYLPNWKGCSYERLYDQLAALGAVALITMDIYIPGGLAYNMHDGTVQYGHTNMLNIQLGYDDDLLAYLTTKPERVHVRLSPDPSQWATTFESWTYAICLRWVPALIFASSAAVALYYLFGHIRVGQPKRGTNRRGPCPGLHDLIRLPIVALLIKLTETVILAFKFGMCGLLATPAWSAPAQLYFIQQMSGSTFSTILIASTFWNRILQDIRPTGASLLKRILTGNFGRVTGLLYMLPIAGETFISIAYATYWDMIQGLHKVSGGFHSLAQLLVGSQFLISAIRFRMEAGAMLQQHHDPKMSAYLNRMSVIVIGLGINCLGYVIGTTLIAVDPNFVRPSGWTLAWSIATISHAIECLLLVLLFRPRSSSSAVGTTVPTTDDTDGFISVPTNHLKQSANRSSPKAGSAAKQ